MSITPQLYEDWKDFFAKKLSGTGDFRLTDAYSRGDTDVEIYSALKNNLETTIEVGYLSSMTLIYLHVFNPQTPGKNRQQEIEHFYKYEFDAEKQYGPPGLDFDEINMLGIANYLNQGFNGKETVYYIKNKPVKSRLTTSYYPDSPGHTTTYHFQEKSLLKTLLDKLLKTGDRYDEIREVDLSNIFKGLNGN